MSITAHHIRVLVHDHEGTSTYVGICELRFIDDADADISKAGMSASASSTLSGSYLASKAIDGSTLDASRWLSESRTDAQLAANPEWLAVDLNGSKTIKELDLCALSSWGDGGAGYGPKVFDIQASDDGINWTTVLNVSGQTGWGLEEFRTYGPLNGFPVSEFRCAGTTREDGAGVAATVEIYDAPTNELVGSFQSAADGAWEYTEQAGGARDVYVIAKKSGRRPQAHGPITMEEVV